MLKTARILKRMSQKTLGERLGISQSYVSRLENEEKYNENITVDLIRRLSIELDLDPIDLFLYFYR
ncbi:helix-turn-helix domain-containing protein [Clostridium brassicae]|uniref:Helix-turn-helix transcriptional regulator n=1 Tax=Clostridium brassicae TaxID=2999072 RepID=A0ABT4D9D0_9CLOT|nr:helix-turn-helix transcriptional regulator [Clostridium brassicae]MCY6958901.1 helix-turn-helix transcriptional regulator [Clostridium brassicae]